MHKITNLWRFGLSWSSKLQENNHRKTHLLYNNLCAFRCRKKASGLKYFNIWVRNYLFVKELRYFTGSRFPQCFNYQQLCIAHYQVSFYANNCFELLPIVSSATNIKLCIIQKQVPCYVDILSVFRNNIINQAPYESETPSRKRCDNGNLLYCKLSDLLQN